VALVLPGVPQGNAAPSLGGVGSPAVTAALAASQFTVLEAHAFSCQQLSQVCIGMHYVYCRENSAFCSVQCIYVSTFCFMGSCGPDMSFGRSRDLVLLSGEEMSYGCQVNGSDTESCSASVLLHKR
jgi:hypothetical protein